MATTATLTSRPNCDICKHERDTITPATHDARIVSGQWAYVCDADFVLCTTHNGRKLGTGIAQKLEVTA